MNSSEQSFHHETEPLKKITKVAPFGEVGNFVVCSLKEQGHPISSIEDALGLLKKNYSQRFLSTAAWLEVRNFGGIGFVGSQIANPSSEVLTATGFEGYLLAQTANPEIALSIIMEFGLQIVDQLRKLDPSVQRLHLDCLFKLKFNPSSIIFWDKQLSCILAFLKARVSQAQSPRGDQENKLRYQSFRDETYRLIGDQNITYYLDEDKVLRYQSPARQVDRHGDIALPKSIVGGYRKQLAWNIINRIGIFAHPSCQFLAKCIAENYR